MNLKDVIESIKRDMQNPRSWVAVGIIMLLICIYADFHYWKYTISLTSSSGIPYSVLSLTVLKFIFFLGIPLGLGLLAFYAVRAGSEGLKILAGTVMGGLGLILYEEVISQCLIHNSKDLCNSIQPGYAVTFLLSAITCAIIALSVNKGTKSPLKSTVIGILLFFIISGLIMEILRNTVFPHNSWWWDLL